MRLKYANKMYGDPAIVVAYLPSQKSAQILPAKLLQFVYISYVHGHHTVPCKSLFACTAAVHPSGKTPLLLKWCGSLTC